MVGYITPTIADLIHKVALCSMDDVVEKNGVMSLTRVDAFRCWARIDLITTSLFSKEGFSVGETKEKRSHRIVIRGRTDTLISSAAWVYQEKLISQPTWYKVLGTGDVHGDGRFTFLDVRVYEVSDNAAKPVNKVSNNSFIPNGTTNVDI